MAGTKEGARKAAITNKLKHGKDFYSKIGRKGGSTFKTKPCGFAANPELARIAGKKGGHISRRGPVKKIINVSDESVDRIVVVKVSDKCLA